MECHSKWNVTQNGMSRKMECHSKWNVTQNGMSLKMVISVPKMNKYQIFVYISFVENLTIYCQNFHAFFG